MGIKVAFIGAGSIGFTRGILSDLLAVRDIRKDIDVSFTDIDCKNLDMVYKLCQRDIESNGIKLKIKATPDRREALKGAKYVFNCSRIGGLEAFSTDIEIPLSYGIDQCVGDTLCAGGIMYGQRGIAAVLDFCRDIKDVSAPDAIMLSYGNPNAMLTWAANKYGGVKTIGLCHGVMGGHAQIASVIELLYNKARKAKKGTKGYREVGVGDVDIICAGINHQTWYTRALFDGEDWCPRLLDGFGQHPTYKRTEKVRIDMLRRFGYYSTESNGHLSEYVAWYRKRPEEIARWIDMNSWIDGETGGYLRVCTEGRNWFETDFPNWMKEPVRDFDSWKRSHEHGSYIIESLETGRVYRGHFNVPNRGCIINLPDDAIVEVPGYVDRNGINIPIVGELPMGCAAVCNNSISVQRLAVEAAVHGDDMLLRQAMMLDPLTGAVCNPPEIWQMTDEMLVAQEKWLPQYKVAIKEAKSRLKSKKRIKTRKGYKGSARLKTKTVAEMKKDREAASKNAAASEK
ncbi:MAG: alpha-glucosidase/alpha-galactosidase [Victivallales bacterium]|nr:alpha-glucosidase/alpha-galactosidase [Victivallales bacterium]